MSTLQIFVIVVFSVMTVAGFVSMGLDKYYAKKGKWRIPEAVLLGIAFFMGGIGSAFGMYVFRHKTNHWYFSMFVPFFAVLSVGALLAVILVL